ncbi:hypothetical protein C8J57DRAFT_1609890 [Mycena rebaudengoi]|nr:hypothetical protein C8J57DRAFT_1609890 [Mycena rebaudengoi]
MTASIEELVRRFYPELWLKWRNINERNCPGSSIQDELMPEQLAAILRDVATESPDNDTSKDCDVIVTVAMEAAPQDAKANDSTDPDHPRSLPDLEEYWWLYCLDVFLLTLQSARLPDFLQLARAAAMMHNITIISPWWTPLNIFDSRTYSWPWKRIRMRLNGNSSSRFVLLFDFSRFSTNHPNIVIRVVRDLPPVVLPAFPYG